MPKQRILHLSTLRENHACLQQVKLFQELFGESVIVTGEKVLSVVNKFDWDWGARKLLSRTALDEYIRIKETAWYGYFRIEKTAWDEYYKTLAKTFANLYINDTGENHA
jgi:hypothetical protein